MSGVLRFGEKFNVSNVILKSQVTIKWDPGTGILPTLLLYFGVYTLPKDKVNINPLWIANVELEHSKTNSKLKYLNIIYHCLNLIIQVLIHHINDTINLVHKVYLMLQVVMMVYHYLNISFL